MIAFVDVHKRYASSGRVAWPLRGVTLTLPPKRNVAVIGAAGAGKSTFLRLIAGVDTPTRGEVRCERRVSWPISANAGMHPAMSGRQNARFVCRVQGLAEDEINEKLRFVHEFSELGDAFDRPVGAYTSGMRRQLSFAVSLAFEFEVYLVESLPVGRSTAEFRKKSRHAMKFLADHADLIMATGSERLARAYCDAAVWLHDGKAHWFESVRDAWREHSKTSPETDAADEAEGE